MPRERVPMRQIREILRLRYEQTLSFSQIAQACGISKTATQKCIRRASEAGLSWPLPEGMNDAGLESLLFPPAIAISAIRKLPDFSQTHQELRKKGVTLLLLWSEYRQGAPEGYTYSRFCQLYRIWEKTLDVVMRQDHKAGEKLFVDYAGMKAEVIDRETGEIREAEVFVAVSGASNYTYTEATWTQGLDDWIGSHVRAFEFFGGVHELLVPDNLKAGVTTAHRYEPSVNPTYQELSRHYGCAVVPARARKPRDKAKVEVGVQGVERRILAVLRHRQFFSLEELNRAIWELLEAYNNRAFQKMPGSRKSQFETLEKPLLKALPSERYEFAEWRKARVNIDYHVEVEKHYYSVPYQLVREEVEVRKTSKVVEIFHKGRRVASHARSNAKYQHSTQEEHMPQSHQEYKGWSPKRWAAWASQAGEATKEVVERIMGSHPHPQQGFRPCLGIMRLGKKYGQERLEAACRRALRLPVPRYRNIESILKTGLDQKELKETAVSPALVHEHLRGAAYYQSRN